MSLQKPANFISRTKKSSEEFLIIHYSCQSLFDDAPGLSPRITSITVFDLSTGQAFSFSTHALAEELGLEKAQVHERFDDVERLLLQRLYTFASQCRGRYWIHWNMRNLTYGFEHLEHRARVLTIENPPVVPPEQRINLSDILRRKFGKDYANHPKMPSLMNLNGGKPKGVLTGEEETQAFARAEFIGMHQSTLAKTGFFAGVVRKLQNGTLVTTSPTFEARLDRIYQSQSVRVAGLVGIVLSVPLAITSIVLAFR